MRRQFLFIIGLFFSMHLFAQTGIGTTSPDASAKLDVSSTNKGFLPPRVTLTSGTDNTTITSPATGLLVYNTGNNAGLVAGYYYWNGTSWATIATAQGSGVSASYMRGSRSTAQTTGITTGGTIVFTQTDNVSGQEISLNTSTGQITLAAGRTYRLIAQVPNFQTSSSDARPQFSWYNETTSAYIGSSSSAYSAASSAGYGALGGLSEVIITTTTSTVISFRIVNPFNANQLGGNLDFNTTGSYPWFEAQVISGNTPVTGQSVDYVQASLSTNQSLSSAGNIIFNISNGIGITITSGGFNLIANKTYKLEAALGGTSGGYAYYGWVDNANNLLPGGSIGTVMKAGSAFTDAPQDKAVVYFTPTANTTVYLRVYSLSGTLTAYAPSMSSNYSSSWANITQIGSSAFVSPWTLSGTNTYNTTGNVGIGTATPATALDVNGTLQVSGNTSLKSNLNIGTGVGAEGGEIQLVNAVTGSTLSGTAVVVDVYQDRLRIFESGGNVRGVFLDLAKAPSGVGGELMWKASGFVAAGTFVNLENLKCAVTTSAQGNRGLSIGAVSTSFDADVSAWYTVSGGNGGGTGNNLTYTTTASASLFNWNFPTHGDMVQANLRDKTNNKFYRITMMIGAGYVSNFISIERLL